MDKKIGIVICNYNKKQFVLSCIGSVLDSSRKDFDVYVVDNASTDGSADAVKAAYGDRVILIQNEENLGGSGGFNTGLRAARQKGYPYYMCVDNDIVMDEHNIENLLCFLEDHPEVGIVGSKICRMQHPERLQELGARLDFEKCTHVPYYKDHLDNEDIPEVQDCDYVPACSLMVRDEVIDKIGVLPEENFIYWDDMEWCYKAKLAGYRVAAYRQAKVLHDMGTNSGDTYFSTYYFWRNRIRFFARYTPQDQREAAMGTLLENVFQTMYGCYYKGKTNQISIMMHALDDAIHHLTGKAAEGKILPKDTIEDRVAGLFETYHNVVVEFNGDYKLLQDIVKKIQKAEAEVSLRIVSDDAEEVQRQYPEYSVIKREQVPSETFEDLSVLWLAMCEHVSKVEDHSLKKVYIDPYSNLLENERDLQHFAGYQYNRDLFVCMWKVLL